MSRLDRSTQEVLLALGARFEYPERTVLLRQGEPGSQLHLIDNARGNGTACVKVTACAKNGSESLLGIRVSGEILGELAPLLGGVRTATVTACTPVAVYKIARDRFTAFLLAHPAARCELERMTAERLDWANRRRLDFLGYPVPVRLARVMLDMCDRHGYPVDERHDIGVRLSQQEWGQSIGAREDAVRQAMRQLRELGLVESAYRQVIIVDKLALSRFADLG